MEQPIKDAMASGPVSSTGSGNVKSSDPGAKKDRLVLVGRSKTEINRGGIIILAEEIDMMLERHPAIDDAARAKLPGQARDC